MEKNLASQSSMSMNDQRTSHLIHGRTSTGCPPPATGTISALQLRRMKRRLFLELVNSVGLGSDESGSFSSNNDSLGGSSSSTDGGFRPSYDRCPSNTSMGSTKTIASRPRRSRAESDVSGLFFSNRSLDTSVASDENGEI